MFVNCYTKLRLIILGQYHIFFYLLLLSHLYCCHKYIFLQFCQIMETEKNVMACEKVIIWLPKSIPRLLCFSYICSNTVSSSSCYNGQDIFVWIWHNDSLVRFPLSLTPSLSFSLSHLTYLSFTLSLALSHFRIRLSFVCILKRKQMRCDICNNLAHFCDKISLLLSFILKCLN